MGRFEQQTVANAESIPENVRKIECPQGPLEMEKEGDYIKFTNFLQIAMSIRLYGMLEDNAQLGIWQRMFSADFRAGFEKIVTEEPTFFDGIKTIGDIPEEKWAALEKKVYTKAN
jgi:hypothetical protein